jgi:uncharacterized Zn finger protein
MTWSRRWLDAVPAWSDNGSQLVAGRKLARRDRPAVDLEPGSATVRFVGRRASCSATVAFRSFSDREWSDIVARIASRPALAASVLTGDLPLELAAGASDDVGLLPESADVSWSCSCEEWDEPCAHAWAVLFALGDLLDRDPNVVLLLRSRSRDQLIEPLRAARGMVSSSGAVSHQPRGVDPGQPIDRRPGRTEPLPRPLPTPWRPAVPVDLPLAPPIDCGLEPGDLTALVADGAARALALLNGEGSSGLHQSVEVDLVRRAAAAPARLDHLATVAGVEPGSLERRAVAWRRGGASALAALEDRWDPPSGVMGPVGSLLGGGRVSANTVTAGRVQLRIDRDGRWWRLDADERLGWLITAGPFDDPAEALD